MGDAPPEGGGAGGPGPATTGDGGSPSIARFVALARAARGRACAELVEQALEAPGVHVFGELLAAPAVRELAADGADGEFAAHARTLELFAHGTYREYLREPARYVALTPAQRKKLQHLTVATLATRDKCIPYASLLDELAITNVRDLEDLVIEAIYADIIHGKLDQKNSRLEVDYALGRDARPEEIDSILATLNEWCDACDAVLACVDQQINRANAEKQRRTKHKESIEQEIVNVKLNLKNQAEVEESVGGPGSSEAHFKIKKPGGKGKSTRNTGKFWQRST